MASSSWPGGIPDLVKVHGDAPAGHHAEVEATPVGQGVAVSIGGRAPYERWEQANVVRGAAKGTVSAYAWARLGDITADQFDALADIQRELGAECRVTNRQNIVFPRPDREPGCPGCSRACRPSAWPSPARSCCCATWWPAPEPTPATWRSPSRGGWPTPSATAWEEEGLSEVGGLRINISGCTNSCGQHHASDIGFFGAERRAHGRSAPGYQMLLGGYVGDAQIHFGTKALRLPARNAPEAVVRVVRQFTAEREAGEEFRHWLERRGGSREVGKGLSDLDEFPAPEDGPDFYVDYDETGPYEAVIGDSECAT